MSAQRMVFLGFGKYARADRIYALEPITGEERGNGRRTLVWVEGMPEPLVASRTQETIIEEMGSEPTPRQARRPRTPSPRPGSAVPRRPLLTGRGTSCSRGSLHEVAPRPARLDAAP